MKLVLKKQPRKFLAACDEQTRKKLYAALDDVANLRGDIKRLQGTECRYRYKIHHYRIIFEWIRGELVIAVIEINTRTNIKY